MNAGTRARLVRGNGTKTIEDDWTVVREENGLVVLEKGATRVSVPRADFDRMNFPGSDTVAAMAAQAGALADFAAGDFPGLRASLLRFAHSLDPAFSGATDTTELEERLSLRIDSINTSLELLRRDQTRAQLEYDRFVGRTALENDRKDSLLTRVRNFEDQISTREHELAALVPRWHELLSALIALDNLR